MGEKYSKSNCKILFKHSQIISEPILLYFGHDLGLHPLQKVLRLEAEISRADPTFWSF